MTMTRLRRRGAGLTAVLLSAALILAACGGDDDTPAPTGTSATTATSTADDPSPTAERATRQFEAENGVIEIPANPQRIVALGSAGVYLSLGVEPVGLGPKASDTELSWLPPEAEQINEAAVDVGEVDYEKVASLEPDLIVVYEPSHVLPQYNEEQLQSVAPTVYIELSTENWETQVERLADALNAADAFEAGKAEYDALVAEIKDEYADLLGSTTFMVLNRWGGDFTPEAGTFNMEFPGGYCVGHLEDAGLTILPEEAPASGDISVELSIEQLSDTVAGADVIIYPLGADEEVKPEFAPVLESNIWKSLPQVQEGRELGVQCVSILTYSSKVVLLGSLKEALGTLPGAE